MDGVVRWFFTHVLQKKSLRFAIFFAPISTFNSQWNYEIHMFLRTFHPYKYSVPISINTHTRISPCICRIIFRAIASCRMLDAHRLLFAPHSFTYKFNPRSSVVQCYYVLFNLWIAPGISFVNMCRHTHCYKSICHQKDIFALARNSEHQIELMRKKWDPQKMNENIEFYSLLSVEIGVVCPFPNPLR